MFNNNEFKSGDMNILNKLTKEEWDSIERPVDKTTQEVLNQMLLYGDISDTKTERSKLKSCGESVYLSTIRPELVKLCFLDKMEIKKDENKIKKPKGKQKKHASKNTAEEIRKQTMATMINRELKEVVDSFNMTKLSYEYGIKNNIVELRMATMLYMAFFFLNNSIPEEEIYRLIQTMRGIIGLIKTERFPSCLNSINSEVICSQMIKDLEDKHKQLEKKVKFNIRNIFNKFPWLTDKSNYFKIIPEFNINLYKCQKELLELTKTSKSFLGFYKSNFGSGKTTATIGVVANQIKTSSIVIYCCASDAVRHTVSQLAYNAGIKFAIANVFRDSIRITNNNLCKDNKDRKLVIADYVTTLAILCDSTKYLPHNKFDDIILIIDEPTDGADESNNIKTKFFSRIFYHCPRRTLLVSATLPSEEELKPYVDLFKHRYGNIETTHILSKDVKVGCEIILRDGTSYTPHSDCKNREDILKVINKLNTNQFLGRLYTANILYAFLDAMEEADIENLPDIDSIFMNNSNLNHNCIKNTALTLLEILSQQQDEVIEIVCQCKSSYSRQDIYKDIKVDKTFDTSKLGTKDAHKFMGPTLLVGNDPFELSTEAFDGLLRGEDATKIINDYKKSQDNEKKAMAKYEKQLDKVANSKSDKDDKMTKEQKQKEIREMMDSIDVKFGFPPWKQINTHSHVVKYGGNIINHIDKRNIRHSMNLANVPLDTSVLDSIKLQRFAGVGIYSPGSQHLDVLYTNDVIENTLAGKLAYTVASTNISYGVNSPADNIIIFDSAIRGKSIGTILQLLARVGRPGLSWTAFAFIDVELRNILYNYIFDKEVYYPDAENMNLALKNYQNELVHEEEMKIAKENERIKIEKEQLDKEMKQKLALVHAKLQQERQGLLNATITCKDKEEINEQRYRNLIEREFKEEIIKIQKLSYNKQRGEWRNSTTREYNRNNQKDNQRNQNYIGNRRNTDKRSSTKAPGKDDKISVDNNNTTYKPTTSDRFHRYNKDRDPRSIYKPKPETHNDEKWR